MIELTQEEYITGTQINYYIVCPTKLWLFTHHITMESESENVQIGKYIHETTYSRENKNIMIDNKISLDFIKNKDKLIIFEIKKTMKLEKAHLYQLYYYLYYLKKIKGIEKVVGMLVFPEQKKREEIEINEIIEREIEAMLLEINKIIRSKNMPIPIKKPYCNKCAYFEFCWV